MSNINQTHIVMNPQFLEDSNLSFNAKGILTYLFAKTYRDGYNLNITNLINDKNDEKTINSGIDELRKAGYMIKTQVKNDNDDGFHCTELVCETPRTEIENNEGRL